MQKFQKLIENLSHNQIPRASGENAKGGRRVPNVRPARSIIWRAFGAVLRLCRAPAHVAFYLSDPAHHGQALVDLLRTESRAFRSWWITAGANGGDQAESTEIVSDMPMDPI
jgi:hypothetical protein